MNLPLLFDLAFHEKSTKWMSLTFSLVTPLIHVHVPSFSFLWLLFLKRFSSTQKPSSFLWRSLYILPNFPCVVGILWRHGDTRKYICYYCSNTDRKWIIKYIDSLYKKLCIPISYLQERQEAWHGITKHMTNDEGVDIAFSINID